jgi:pimeloyl-ACP methyl ester carboxylesterase
VVSAANGIDYAYREVGEGTQPLILLQHFRGNLDNWDPALIDALASARRVVTFDNTGVGGSTGTTPGTITQMAIGAIAFLEAMELVQVDVLGFSIGSGHHGSMGSACWAAGRSGQGMAVVATAQRLRTRSRREQAARRWSRGRAI